VLFCGAPKTPAFNTFESDCLEKLVESVRRKTLM